MRPPASLQAIVGVNKYAQHGEGEAPREEEIRRIDNTAVLRRQRERLGVRARCAGRRACGRDGDAGQPRWSPRCAASRQEAAGESEQQREGRASP